MAAIARWNYGQLLNVFSILIEKSDQFTGGVWAPLAEVLYPYVQYDDEMGTVTDWYRFKVKQFTKIVSEPVNFSADTMNLQHSPLIPYSEQVLFGIHVCVKDVDYSIDYSAGTVTRLPGGQIPALASVNVDYNFTTVSVPTIAKQVQVVPRCKVYGFIYDTNGYPIGAEQLAFVIVRPPQIRGNHILIAAPKIIETSADGYFEVDLYQGSVVRVQNPRAGLDKEFVVPAIDVKDFKAILEELA